jgi:hypothetical protein
LQGQTLQRVKQLRRARKQRKQLNNLKEAYQKKENHRAMKMHLHQPLQHDDAEKVQEWRNEQNIVLFIL